MIDGAIVGDTVRFTRMWGSRNLRQDYTGKLTVGADGRGKITGTFTQNLKGSFPWTATSTFPIKNGSSAAASPAATKPNAAPGGALPIDVSGSWSFRGDRNKTGRVNIWQTGSIYRLSAGKNRGNLKAGIWSSYKRKGTQGRRMVSKFLLPPEVARPTRDTSITGQFPRTILDTGITRHGKERRTSIQLLQDK